MNLRKDHYRSFTRTMCTVLYLLGMVTCHHSLAAGASTLSAVTEAEVYLAFPLDATLSLRDIT